MSKKKKTTKVTKKLKSKLNKGNSAKSATTAAASGKTASDAVMIAFILRKHVIAAFEGFLQKEPMPKGYNKKQQQEITEYVRNAIAFTAATLTIAIANEVNKD